MPGEEVEMEIKETVAAEKLRRTPLRTNLGKCPACGEPVFANQEHLLRHGVETHALCFYDPAYAKRTLDAAG
jgi:hypothetical protein